MPAWPQLTPTRCLSLHCVLWVAKLRGGADCNCPLCASSRPGAMPEPNSLSPNENCVVANATQGYDVAWGWADQNCATQFAAMCKIPGTPSGAGLPVA